MDKYFRSIDHHYFIVIFLCFLYCEFTNLGGGSKTGLAGAATSGLFLNYFPNVRHEAVGHFTAASKP
jgi:hypothetical protein